MSKRPNASRPRRWLINAVFAAVVLLAAGGLWLALGAGGEKQAAHAAVDFGQGIVETLPLDTDYDYFYEVGDYIVHLQVRDGTIAFVDSPCPDHLCEGFGRLSREGDWAACMPAQVSVTVQ